MAIHRKTIWLASLATVLLSASLATAQKYQPFGPLEYQHDAQPFAPFDSESFGNDPGLFEGWFANFDRLYWAIGSPDKGAVGAAGTTNDTGYLRNLFGWGNRYEVGYVDGDKGWIFSAFDVNSRLEVLNIASITATQRSKFQNWELMKILRVRQLHGGSNVELFYGVRYLVMEDHFGVMAANGNVWNSRVLNNVVGPQAGVRWLHRRGDWRIDIEGRFSPAFNFQNAHLNSNLAAGQVIHTLGFEHFSPIIELRFETNYQITRNAAFRAGWAGVYVDRIGRANNMIDYVPAAQGLRRFRENLFTHGLTMGIEINH